MFCLNTFLTFLSYLSFLTLHCIALFCAHILVQMMKHDILAAILPAGTDDGKQACTPKTPSSCPPDGESNSSGSQPQDSQEVDDPAQGDGAEDKCAHAVETEVNRAHAAEIEEDNSALVVHTNVAEVLTTDRMIDIGSG